MIEFKDNNSLLCLNIQFKLVYLMLYMKLFNEIFKYNKLLNNNYKIKGVNF